MDLPAAAIVGIVGLVLALPPAIFHLLVVLRRRAQVSPSVIRRDGHQFRVVLLDCFYILTAYPRQKAPQDDLEGNMRRREDRVISSRRRQSTTW
ncbi:hypothetical protein F5Y19DRAFT_326068 [Xylariaceae sp. FL1651]|nr:hypothetical protein F5Y19DRAFT_326068 [Xylariaceae sp. FL1651]